MSESTVEHELRQEIRKVCSAARAAGTIATRMTAAAEQGSTDRWQQLGLLHAGVPEHLGGAGADPALAFAIAEECARELVAPPRVLDGLWAAHSLAVMADDSAAARGELERVLDGDVPAVCWPGLLGADANLRWAGGAVSGTLSVPERARDARLLLVASAADGTARLGLVDLADAESTGHGEYIATTSLDPTRPSARVVLSEAPARELGILSSEQARRLRGFWLLVAAADSLGAMQANLALALDHVRVREAFGRPIGAFQAVRHRCVDVYVDVETTRAAVYGAGAAWARLSEGALVDAIVAVSHALDAQVRVAESVVLLHGAFGFTYECDAQFYLRRAYTVRALLTPVRALRIELATA